MAAMMPVHGTQLPASTNATTIAVGKRFFLVFVSTRSPFTDTGSGWRHTLDVAAHQSCALESHSRGYEVRLVAPDNRHAFTVLSRRKPFWCSGRRGVVLTQGGRSREDSEWRTSYVYVPLSDEIRALLDVPRGP